MIDTKASPGQDTKEFARANHVKPQTVRKRYSATGSYFGIKPRKLKNGRLDWPPVSDALARTLLEEGRTQ